MNWESAYEKHVNCGDGLEKYAHRDMSQDEYDVNVCQRFFTRISENFCVNIGMHNKENKKSNGQWCYVSRQCKELNGGKIVDDTRAAWKRCAGGDDEHLRDMDPEDVAVKAQDLNLDVATMLKMSYPVWEKHYWSEVRSFFLENATAPIAEEDSSEEDTALYSKMQELKHESARPMLFMHPRGEDQVTFPPGLVPYGEDRTLLSLVWGKQVYHVVPTAEPQQYSPATWHELVCVQGC